MRNPKRVDSLISLTIMFITQPVKKNLHLQNGLVKKFGTDIPGSQVMHPSSTHFTCSTSRRFVVKFFDKYLIYYHEIRLRHL